MLGVESRVGEKGRRGFFKDDLRSVSLSWARPGIGQELGQKAQASLCLPQSLRVFS